MPLLTFVNPGWKGMTGAANFVASGFTTVDEERQLSGSVWYRFGLLRRASQA